MKHLPENVVLILKALVPLFAIISLFFVLGNVGFVKILEVREEIEKTKQKQAILTEKLDLLRSVSVNGVRDSNAATIALPPDSPALAAISQIRTMAAGYGIIVTGVKARANPTDSGEINSVNVEFNVNGPKNAVVDFLAETRNIAPITLLYRVKLTEINGAYTGVITANSYWSSLPTKLPASIDGFQELNADDKTMLEFVNTLRQPTLIELPAPSQNLREDPFN